MDKKNVLWIIADQFRGDCLGIAGNPIIQTPNLDALARDGVFFSNCFVQTAPCGPSRMSIYTSRYLCSTRTVRNYTPLADAHENIAMHAREAGFRPVFFGYNDYAVDPAILPEGDPRRTGLSYDNVLPGFEVGEYFEHHSPGYFEYLRQRGYPEDLCGPRICTEYDIPPEGTGDALPLRFPARYKAEDSGCQYLTRRALDFVGQQKESGWFLSLNYIKPHPPRICPAPFHAMYDPAAMPPPARCAHELTGPHPYMRMVRPQPLLTNDRALRETQANYYGMISEVDACIGLLVQALKEGGEWDNTVVVFMSDHGEYLGDHYLLDKGHFYDGGMHVPLIVRDPSARAGVSRGSIHSGMVESIDVAPTIHDALNISIPDRFQGKSLLPLLHGSNTSHREAIHYEFDFRAYADPSADPDACLLWVVRDAHYKYVQFARDDMPPLLFDLKNDPSECNNIANEAHAGLVTKYCQHLLRWRMRHEDQRMERWASQFR